MLRQAEGIRISDPLVIAFGHKAKRGKDTAAQHIIENRTAPFLNIKRYAFADDLKREVNAAAEEHGGMLGLFDQLTRVGAPLPGLRFLKLPLSVAYDPSPDMTDPLSPLGKQRKLLQWWGTEYRRNNFHRMYWVKSVNNAIFTDRPDIALITDMRFMSEVVWVNSMRGYTVRVDRVGFPDLDTNPEHDSEHELDSYTYNFEINVRDGDLEILKEDALTVFDMILKHVSVDPIDLEGARVVEQAAA